MRTMIAQLPTIQHVLNGTATRGKTVVYLNRGAALFLAISLLALFSLLGVTYVRYMSIEQDSFTLHLRKIRAKHYAEAGVQSATAHIREAISNGDIPASSTTFFYPTYGWIRGKDTEKPSLLDMYSAEARVSILGMKKDEWDARYSASVAFPGDNHAWLITSAAALQRNDPSGPRILARHALEVVIAFENDNLSVISWNTCR